MNTDKWIKSQFASVATYICIEIDDWYSIIVCYIQALFQLALGATSGLTAMTQEVEAQDSLFVEKDGAGPIKATLSLIIIMVACFQLIRGWTGEKGYSKHKWTIGNENKIRILLYYLK